MFLNRMNKIITPKQSLRFAKRSKFIACISISLSMLVNANFASAEEKCPVWTAEDAPKMEHTGQYKRVGKWQPDKSKQVYVQKKGTRLAETAYKWNRGVWFHMPLGYFSQHPSKLDTEIGFGSVDTAHEYTNKAARIIAHKKRMGDDFEEQADYHARKWYAGNGYAFWMPDLRYLERDTRHMAYLRPCEAGRPKPTKEQYVVKFSIISPYLEKPWLSPDSLWTKDFIKRMETWWYKDQYASALRHLSPVSDIMK